VVSGVADDTGGQRRGGVRGLTQKGGGDQGKRDKHDRVRKGYQEEK